MEYYLLAAEEGDMGGISQSITIYFCRYNWGKGLKHMYNAVYYCKKYIKLSDSKTFCKTDKEYVTNVLSELSKICRTCGEKGYKYCSKCTCVVYCSVECQRIDWKENGHKEECKKIE